MEDTSRNKALNLCRIIADRNVADVLGLDLEPLCSWASYLVLGTVSSRVQLQGVAQAVADAMREQGQDIRSGSKRNDESSWRIIDGGDIVVSLMDQASREFYALEDRWFEADVIFGERPVQSSISS